MKEQTVKTTPELTILAQVVHLVTDALHLTRTLATHVTEAPHNGAPVLDTKRGFDAGNMDQRLTHLVSELKIREDRIDELTTQVADMSQKLDTVLQFLLTGRDTRVVTSIRAPATKPARTPKKGTPGRLVNAGHKVTTKTIIDPTSFKAFRKLKALSQPQMANFLHTSTQTIGNWETGYTRIRPGFRGAAKLAHKKMLEVNHTITYMTNPEFTRRFPKKLKTRK